MNNKANLTLYAILALLLAGVGFGIGFEGGEKIWGPLPLSIKLMIGVLVAVLLSLLVWGSVFIDKRLERIGAQHAKEGIAAGRLRSFHLRIESILDHGDTVMVAGPFSGELPERGDRIQIVGEQGATLAVIQDATTMGAALSDAARAGASTITHGNVFSARAAFVLGGIKGSDIHKGNEVLPSL